MASQSSDARQTSTTCYDCSFLLRRGELRIAQERARRDGCRVRCNKCAEKAELYAQAEAVFARRVRH